MALLPLSTSGTNSLRRCLEFSGFYRPLRNGFLTVLLVFGFFFPLCANGQLSKQDDSLNPLRSTELKLEQGEEYSSPVFVDFDGDGDDDAFVGFGTPSPPNGKIAFYENIDSTPMKTDPIFDRKYGPDNPLSFFDGNDTVKLDLADIDKDGDLDAFVTVWDGTFNYYENNNGVFQAPDPGNDPFQGITIDGTNPQPAFFDIDNDNDVDLFIGLTIGQNNGEIHFFKNSSGTFSRVMDGTSPFTNNENPPNELNFGENATPSFEDIDGDSNPDVIIGSLHNIVHYEINQQDNFEQRTGSSAYLEFTVQNQSFVPAVVDIDNDGIFEVFIGKYNGQIDFYDQPTIQPGDINGDGNIMLDDTILGLQIVVGVGTGDATTDAEVNGDDPPKIGLEEVIFTLRDVAGLNQ